MMDGKIGKNFPEKAIPILLMSFERELEISEANLGR